MYTGKTAGWTGRIDRPVRPAQHTNPRRAISIGAPRPRAPLDDLPGAGVPDPLVDTTPAGGLHKFDLGMVPASVTPPRTWRRAAWFAVASAAAALGGLVFATAALVNQSTSTLRLPPNMPRGGEYPPLRPTDPHHLKSEPAGPGADRAETSLGLRAPSAPRASARPKVTPVGEVVGSGRPALAAPGWSRPSTSRPPTREAPRLLALSNAELVKQRSQDYFAAVTSADLHRAYALTTGALRNEGYEAFASRYAGTSSIEVTEVFVGSGRTLTTLRITRNTGAVETQRRELRFTMGDDPLINADDLLRN